MKLPCLALLAALLGAAHASAALHSLSLTGAVAVETAPGVVKSFPFTTAKLISAAIIASGSTASLKPSQVQLVYDDSSHAIQAVTKSDRTLVFTYAQEGSNYSEGTTLTVNSKKSTLTSVLESDYEFQVVDTATAQHDTAYTTVLLRTKTSTKSGFLGSTATFVGSSSSSDSHHFIIQGSFKIGPAFLVKY